MALLAALVGLANEGEGVVVDVELAVAGGQLERAEGARLQIERLLGGRAPEAGLLAGEEVASRSPARPGGSGVAVVRGAADFLAGSYVLAQHTERAESEIGVGESRLRRPSAITVFSGTSGSLR